MARCLITLATIFLIASNVLNLNIQKTYTLVGGTEGFERLVDNPDLNNLHQGNISFIKTQVKREVLTKRTITTSKKASDITQLQDSVIHPVVLCTLTRTVRRVCPWDLNQTEDSLDSLGRLLKTVVVQEMTHCDLVLAYDHHYHPLLRYILTLGNVKQVWRVRGPGDLLQVSWSSNRCRGYLLMISHSEHLANFTNTYRDAWDYHGRYIVVANSLHHLETLLSSEKGRRTEHLVGLLQTGEGGEWRVYKGIEVRVITTWRGHTFTSHLPLFPRHLDDLQGAQIKVATFKWEPNVFYNRNSTGDLQYRYGVDIDLISILATFYNVSVQYIEPAEGELWGDRRADGSWSGMMGLLDRGEADVGVASIYVSSHRTSVVDFTTPYDSRMSCFMAWREQSLPQWHALTYPFTALTWISILVGFLVAGPVLYLLARASDIWGGGESSDLQEFGYSWLYSFGVHMKVAQDQLPTARSTQVLVTFLWIYTMILTLGYSTNLTAYLIVAKTPTSINTISELRQSGVEVAGLGEFYKYALASAIDQDLQSLTKTYRAHQSVETIFPRVLEGRSVFLQNRAFIEFVRLSRFTRRGESTIRIMKECFAPYSIAMAVQRHSPFKRKFDKVIGWLQQAGLMRQLFLNSLRLAASTEEYGKAAGEEGVTGGVAQGPGSEGGENDLTPLTVIHLQGVFFVVVFGWCVSSLVFLVEMKMS